MRLFNTERANLPIASDGPPGRQDARLVVLRMSGCKIAKFLSDKAHVLHFMT